VTTQSYASSEGSDIVPLLRGSTVRLVQRGHWVIIEITGPGPKMRRMRVTIDELAAISELTRWKPAASWSGIPTTGAA
jgi:hypothetical protein